MELLKAIQESAVMSRVGWTLIHTLWMGAGVAGLFAITLLFLRRRSANARYLASCVALVVMVALPVGIFFVVPESFSTSTVDRTLRPQLTEMPDELVVEEITEPAVLLTGLGAAGAEDSPVAVTVGPTLMTRVSLAIEPALPWAVLAWVAGVIAMSLWQLCGWIAAERLKRLGTQPCGRDLTEIVMRLVQAMHIGRRVRVLESVLVRIPTVLGWLRPIILLPAGIATGLTAEQLQAIIAHELAHIRRHDYLVNLLQSLAEILFFYHPAVWFISGRIRTERENCCDDIVVAAGAEPFSYAESLLQVARRSMAYQGRQIAPAVALGATGKPSQLRTRIGRILGDKAQEATRLGRSWPAALSLLATIIIATSLLTSVQAGLVAAKEQKTSQPTAHPAATSQESKTYEVSIPEQWKPYLSVGKLTVIGKAFYGVRSKFFGLFPVVRIHWSLKNLTSEPMFLNVNYRSPRPNGPGGSGFGVGYVLKAHEEYSIEDVVPVFSAKIPTALQIRLIKLWLPGKKLNLSSYHLGVMTEPLKVSSEQPSQFDIVSQDDQRVELKKVHLMPLEDHRNALEITMVNKTNQTLWANVEVAIGDPVKADNATPGMNPLARSKGSFSSGAVTIHSQSHSTIRLPYSVPSDAGEMPVLVFRLFESNQHPDANLKRRLGLTEEELHVLRYGRVISVGCVDLREAAEKGQVALPVRVPVKERATLISQKHSKHFLFRYRPNSYAARNIDIAIKDREEAYKRLSAVLRMELPKTVTIDLYPDMEAKGLGSGTKWTPANTVTNTHIAEVYNETYQCDAFHELVHIFSYHFPNHGGSGGGGLTEAFAVYFEPDNFQMGPATDKVRQKLNEGNLRSLDEILLNDSLGEDEVVLIDFLLKHDLEKFKRLYVSVRRAKGLEDLEKACQDIYKTDLKGLEKQWHGFLGLGLPEGQAINPIIPGLGVGDYKLGMSKDDGLKALGNPNMIFYGEEKYTLGNLPKRYYMMFDDISLLIVDDIVKEIAVHSPRYKFANGLGVGDSERNIKKVFGDNFQLRETEWKDFLIYEDKGVEFEINKRDRTVMEINVRAAPGLDQQQKQSRVQSETNGD